MIIFVLLISIFLTLAFLDKYTKNKTLSQLEVTILGVAAIAIGGGVFSFNEIFITSLLGLAIVSIGFTASIYGLIKG